MRLIDANALIGELHNTYLYGDNARKVIYRKIEEQPTIEPQRIKGRWLKKENVGRWDDTLWECSECGCLHRDNVFCISGDFNFCPNCGADMRGDDDEA